MNEIFVGVDGSEVSKHTVHWAAREAVLHDAPLVIGHALQKWLYDMPEHAAHGHVGRWAREDASRLLDDAATVARYVAPDVDVTTRMLSGDARPALLEAAANASVLVVGGRGEGGFTGLLLGSVAHGVASHAGVPVTVAQGPLGDPDREIVVGVERSTGSAAALDLAFAEASVREVPLRAVYAWRRVSAAMADAWLITGPEAIMRAEHADENAARAALADMVAAKAASYPDVKLIEQLEVGHPTDVLLQAASNADLLVVGRRGGGLFPHLRVGSVSHGVLHHSPCPVMIVPH
jgi:nucleotide-binding universal stress UspA family protein